MLIVQGVLFGDGGITTMGANIINMGVIGGFVGYYGYQAMLRATRSMYVSAGVAAWLACVVPALAASVELALAGTFPFVPGLVGMGLYHALIGCIEAVITVTVLALIANARPGHPGPLGGGAGMTVNRGLIAVGIAIALVIGVAAVFLASSDPDGLDSTALITQGQKELHLAGGPGRGDRRVGPPGLGRVRGAVPGLHRGGGGQTHGCRPDGRRHPCHPRGGARRRLWSPDYPAEGYNVIACLPPRSVAGADVVMAGWPPGIPR